MLEPSLKITKIWEDVDFFEIKMKWKGISCTAIIDIYTTNESLEELRKGITEFSSFIKEEFTWDFGEDSENVTHFLSMRFFKHTTRGHIGIEVILDNKLNIPDYMRTHFFIVTELHQLDDFVRKLEKFINEEIMELEAFIPWES